MYTSTFKLVYIHKEFLYVSDNHVVISWNVQYKALHTLKV